MLCINLIRNKVRNFKFADILRTLFFYVPFLAPIIIYGFPPLNIEFNFEFFLAFGLAILGSTIGLLFQYKQILPYLDKEFYELLPDLSFKWFVIIEISLVASVVCEEIFYRFFLPESNLILDCIICGILFSLAHYIDKYTRSEFTFKSYVILFCLSICWLISFKISNSLLPAMLGHLLYNLPKIISVYFQYKASSSRLKKVLNY